MFDLARSCRFVSSAFNRMIRRHVITFTVVLKMNPPTTLDEAFAGLKEGTSAKAQGSNGMKVAGFIFQLRD